MKNIDLTFLKKIWQYLSYPLFELGGTKVSILSFISALLIVLVGFVIATSAQRITRKLLTKWTFDEGLKGSLEKLIRYMVVVISFFIAFDSIGISLQSLAALGAVFVAVIGFGLQHITQNLIAGVVILIERPIKVGDIVDVDGVKGRVLDVKARFTLIQTLDDVAIIVPNAKFITENVHNESFSGQMIRLGVKVGVAYGSDVDQVRDTLVSVAKRSPDVLASPSPSVLFRDFGESSLDLELKVWVRDLWREDIILSELRFEIDKAFKTEGITIPFPQRDIHLFQKNENSSAQS